MASESSVSYFPLHAPRHRQQDAALDCQHTPRGPCASGGDIEIITVPWVHDYVYYILYYIYTISISLYIYISIAQHIYIILYLDSNVFEMPKLH